MSLWAMATAPWCIRLITISMMRPSPMAVAGGRVSSKNVCLF